MSGSSGKKGVGEGSSGSEAPLKERWVELLDQLERAGRLQSERIRAAMEANPRWFFLPSDASHEVREATLRDAPIGIAKGQTISAPHMVAILLERTDPRPGDRCLEIGAGSGWLAACLRHVVAPGGHVVAVEIVPELVELARWNLDVHAPDTVEVIMGDGGLGYPEGGPYDVIIASCGAPEVPEPLTEQLTMGGRLLIPVGPRSHQRLIRITRTEEGLQREDLGGCAFVPLVGQHGF